MDAQESGDAESPAPARGVLRIARRLTYIALGFFLGCTILLSITHPKKIYLALVPLTAFMLGLIFWMGSGLAGVIRFSLGWLMLLVLGTASCATAILILEGPWRWLPAGGLVVLFIWLADRYFRELFEVQDRREFERIAQEMKENKKV